MPIVPAGQLTDRDYHRVGAVRSAAKATEAARLESLRQAACAAGADAVLEAANEEVRDESGATVHIASGTAVVWVAKHEP
jgi:uncharacterized protein YbjQ (UPF0145 family)